ncbi:PREDICTED: transmembrane protein 26-like isoform X2 [Branchiostoma belcheri]|uniref:Transmembrane protein 26-like isoform X2 n=1 Tax=Branchiostoma belcheri TaxID=7741 RepID=A0A6P4Y306_BRABE|nr:PREDICTED: transmembrane protein 26-like isoform X2 [Branchiostoma belcheri]
MCFSAQRTILARLLFSCTVGICYMQVFVMVTDPPLHLSWPIVLGAALILVEMCVALYRGKEDWKWFSPAVFLYLASTIPSVWLLEMTLHRERVQLRENATSQHQETIRVGELSLEVNGEDWVRALEQVIFLTLILGRWVMPRSALSRDQLSELLLVYVTAGADILELFSLLDEDNIKYKEIYIYPILGLFTLGMVQFPIMFTSFHDKPLPKLIKNNSVSPVEDPNAKSTNRLNNNCCGCCTKEVIGIFMTLLMQDGPFLALRLYFMIQERIFHNLMVFFVGKNFVVIVLQIYRLVSIACYDDDDDNEDDQKNTVKDNDSDADVTVLQA